MRHYRPVLFACLFIAVMSAGCSKNSSQPTVIVNNQVTPTAKRYHLKGKVVSVDKQSKMLNVDGEAVPDFMSAMTMPYDVKPESELDQLKPGDTITADVAVQDEKAWLENIVVTGHATAVGKPQ